MLHPSTKRLIDKLSEMTRKQRVAWTQGEDGAVVHDTEGYRVVLTPAPHSVLLTDSLGREIETCRPEEFADELDSHARPYTKFVGELYREASRHARGTERAIQTLLAELDAAEQSPASKPEPAVIAAIGLPDATTDETAPLESETEITAAVANLADQINGAQLAGAPPVPAQEPEPAAQPAPVVLAAAQSEPHPEPAAVPLSEPQPAKPGPAIETAAPEPVPSGEPTAGRPPPPVEAPAPANEPGSFGTFAAFEPSASEAPAQETVMVDAPAAAPEPATAAQPDPVAEPPSPLAEPPQPPPTPALAQPTLAGPISLSSIPFGFGLGVAQRQGAPVHPATSAPPEPEPAPAGEPPKRILIDGTLDLPDFTPDSLEADAEGTYPPPAPESGRLDLPGEPAPAAPEPGQPRRFNPWT